MIYDIPASTTSIRMQVFVIITRSTASATGGLAVLFV